MKNSAQTLTNNFNYIRGNRCEADKAKFVIAHLRESTGLSQQSAIVKMILFGAENRRSPFYRECREALDAWESVKAVRTTETITNKIKK